MTDYLPDRPPANEADILFAYKDIELGSALVRVSEITFLEGLELWSYGKDFLQDLADTFLKNDLSILELFELFGRHPETVNRLLRHSTGLEDAVLRRLREADELLLAFWEVNQDFFTRRLGYIWQARRPPTPAQTAPATD